jgi:hypothetical protein
MNYLYPVADTIKSSLDAGEMITPGREVGIQTSGLNIDFLYHISYFQVFISTIDGLFGFNFKVK